jgi:hypothetical protein
MRLVSPYKAGMFRGMSGWPKIRYFWTEVARYEPPFPGKTK